MLTRRRPRTNPLRALMSAQSASRFANWLALSRRWSRQLLASAGASRDRSSGVRPREQARLFVAGTPAHSLGYLSALAPPPSQGERCPPNRVNSWQHQSTLSWASGPRSDANLQLSPRSRDPASRSDVATSTVQPASAGSEVAQPRRTSTRSTTTVGRPIRLLHRHMRKIAGSTGASGGPCAARSGRSPSAPHEVDHGNKCSDRILLARRRH